MTLEYLVYTAWVILAVHSYLIYKLIKVTNLKVNSGDILNILEIMVQILAIIKSNPSQKDIEAVERLLAMLINKYKKDVK